MKYIRTKDGIMKIDFEIGTELPVMIGIHTKECEVGEYRGVEVIKQADTLEELCDEAVFFDNNNKPHYKSQEGNIWYLGAGLYTGTLRLGIFTDKGLIYVAKMNEKGELELI